MTARWRGDWLQRRAPRRPELPAAPAPTPLALRDVERTLTLFVAGLTERQLTITGSAEATTSGAYTDGRTIFLPQQLQHAATRADNLRIYKLLIAHAAAQHRYGTLTPDNLAALKDDYAMLAPLLEIIEGARLAAHLARDFPGLGREQATLLVPHLPQRPAPATLRGRTQMLEILLRATVGDETALMGLRGRTLQQVQALNALLPAATAWEHLTWVDSIALIRTLHARLDGPGTGPAPTPLLGRSRLRLDRVRPELVLPPPPPAASRRDDPEPPPQRIDLPRPAPPLIVEGRGQLPDLPDNSERRAPVVTGRQMAVSYADTSPQFTSRLVPLTDAEKRGALTYPEWDVTLGTYRPEWVALRPRRLRAGSTDWVERVLRRRHAEVQTLKRQFETLRPERQRLRRQDDGDDLDLDMLVAAHVDRKLGLAPDERPYARTREDRRDIAVALLLDLSGSTGGYLPGPHGGARVIDVAKEAAVMFGEALTMLNDRYAIYGFSGSTRKNCEFYTVKDFSDAWDDDTKQRLGGLAPLAYTRLGPPLRHTTMLLHGVAARVKLLLLLSDGRPNDFDAYGGEYGIADTHKALLEARGRGVRTFCLTIDAEARDYMPRLFGPDNFVTLADVASLPRRLPDLYRRLTVG